MDNHGEFIESGAGQASNDPLFNLGVTPRIECSAVSSYTGRKVRIVGELVGVRTIFFSSHVHRLYI